MHVTVVGAGLGGLCVANGLLRAGMEVEVLEAHDGIRETGQGYRINVNASGHAGLRICLTDERFHAYQRTLHRQHDPGVYLYSPALQLLSRHEAPPAPGAIDRGALRRVLAEGVGGRIRFGRRVVSVTEIGHTDLIVAADGVGSALRRELIAHPGPQPLHDSAAIFGRTPLTERTRPWMPPAIHDTRFTGIVEDAIALALCAYDPPEPAATAPYVIWVLMGPRSELPDRDAAPIDLLRFAESRTAHWDPRVTVILRETTASDTFYTPLRAVHDIPEPPARSGTPVAFLGDAIHAMSPAGGEGANTAFADAALLVSQLRTAPTIADAVADYHAEMRVTAGAALRRSASYGHPREPSHA
ncbi:FAD-dependent monooxygenase [Nocardia terpenica]|uniref:NAD(P)/FAD-dependent oxidoreductase n=1 Tax=Nocardia terpenica TaxID=455432 RepID=UPI002FE09851